MTCTQPCQFYHLICKTHTERKQFTSWEDSQTKNDGGKTQQPASVSAQCLFATFLLSPSGFTYTDLTFAMMAKFIGLQLGSACGKSDPPSQLARTANRGKGLYMTQGSFKASWPNTQLIEASQNHCLLTWEIAQDRASRGEQALLQESRCDKWACTGCRR